MPIQTARDIIVPNAYVAVMAETKEKGITIEVRDTEARKIVAEVLVYPARMHGDSWETYLVHQRHLAILFFAYLSERLSQAHRVLPEDHAVPRNNFAYVKHPQHKERSVARVEFKQADDKTPALHRVLTEFSTEGGFAKGLAEHLSTYQPREFMTVDGFSVFVAKLISPVRQAAMRRGLQVINGGSGAAASGPVELTPV